MGAMPAAAHGAMAEASTMGLGQQHAFCSLLECDVGLEDDAHSPAAEGRKIHRHSITVRCSQLQPSLLGVIHGPIVHVAASTRRAADVGQSVERKHPL